MTTILVTGANGQLGSELQQLAAAFPHFEFRFTDHAKLDITDAEAIEHYFTANRINYLINCAAYTAVDAAEEDAEAALRLNATAVELLAAACRQQGARLIQISTDYVFDGTGHLPYRESDPVSPTSVYGTTKLLGEQAALSDGTEAIVVRTSWLYSEFGSNFVKTMMRLGKERDQLGVICDQVGSPTYAADLAAALLQIVEKAESGGFVPGIYHYANEGVCSWYDFTKAIHRLSDIHTCAVRPIESDDYPTQAKRPHFSLLNKRKIRETYALEIPHWEESLARCIDKIKQPTL